MARRSRRGHRLKERFVLVFWTESETISVVNEKNIIEAVNKNYKVKVGLTIDLPWVENNSVELYEAKLLRISKNKSYLESLEVTVCGQIIKKQLPKSIMSEKKQIKSNAASKKKLIADGRKTLTKSSMALPDISNSKHQSAQHTLPSASTTSAPDLAVCENCKRCVCKSWSSYVTPEYIKFMQMQLNEYMKTMTITDNTIVKHADIMVELASGTGIIVSQTNLNFIISKSNGTRALVRNLLQQFFSDEKLVEYSSADVFITEKPEYQMAIIGYINQTFPEAKLTAKEFTDIINKKMYDLRLYSKMTPAEKEKYKEKKRLASKENREKKKLLKMSSSTTTTPSLSSNNTVKDDDPTSHKKDDNINVGNSIQSLSKPSLSYGTSSSNVDNSMQNTYVHPSTSYGATNEWGNTGGMYNASSTPQLTATSFSTNNYNYYPYDNMNLQYENNEQQYHSYYSQGQSGKVLPAGGEPLSEAIGSSLQNL